MTPRPHTRPRAPLSHIFLVTFTFTIVLSLVPILSLTFTRNLSLQQTPSLTRASMPSLAIFFLALTRILTPLSTSPPYPNSGDPEP